MAQHGEAAQPGEAAQRQDASSQSSLYYVADPMCSWCWGFAPTLRAVSDNLPADTVLRYVMGGLAPDSDEPMPAALRQRVEQAWRAVAKRTGAEFNHDFWIQCQPRRSTYPACRAVLAAALQDAGPAMFAAIQRAYYLEAHNPSLDNTLVELAGELSLDPIRFADDLISDLVEERLQQDLALARRLQVTGFPSLVLETPAGRTWVARGYDDPDVVVSRLHAAVGPQPS